MLQCLCILSRCFDNNSLVFISSLPSLFTRATKQFLPCWRSPKHTNPLWDCEGEHWPVHHDTCHQDFLKAHRDGSHLANVSLIFGLLVCFCLVVCFVWFFCLTRKKLFTDKADQSWDSYSIPLGSVSTLIRDSSWSAAGLHDACVAHHQRRGVAWASGLFWLMNSVADNSSQYVSMHVHESDLLTPTFVLFTWSLSLSGLVTVFTGEFVILFSIQTCAFSFIFWMSQAL